MGASESILVWRLRRGDPAACRELIRRHHASVYGYLRRLGADSRLAEDLTQETYARAWQAIRTLRKTASLRSWLLTIARNQFFQQARSAGPATVTPEDLAEQADDRPGAETVLVDDERDRRLRRAVLRLDPALREAIALHYFQGLSLRQTGTVLGVPGGTVKSRVNRALGLLHALLEKTETDHENERAGTAVAGTS